MPAVGELTTGGAPTYRAAIESLAGPAGDALINAFREHDAVFVPTLHHDHVRTSTGQDREWLDHEYQTLADFVARAHDAGVIILAGSNAAGEATGIDAGPSIHEELARLVEAGLTPLEALTCCHRRPGRTP